MFTPFSPYGQAPFTRPAGTAAPQQQRGGLVPPEQNLPRAVNYYADYSGCGFWRMVWPEHVLNAFQQLAVTGQTVMVGEPRYYEKMSAVRIQRQATSAQKQFVEHLKQLSSQFGFKIIYEIDDVIFREDIPDYNKFKPAFVSDEIRQSSQEIMEMCDEVTVTCPYMRDYYLEKTNQKNITVIPNYPPRFWLGHCYSEERVRANFQQFKAQPRVLYAGSGAHFDVDNRVKQQDDFYHVSDAIIKSRKRFKWVFVGAYPKSVEQYIRTGEMEFHEWRPLYDYPELIKSLNVSAAIAPLMDNPFNNAKSNIKYVEAAAYGTPLVCQDIETYRTVPGDLKFTSGGEMVDKLSYITGNKKAYLNHVHDAYDDVQKMWLELPDNYGKYRELYTLPYGSDKRVLLNSVNDYTLG